MAFEDKVIPCEGCKKEFTHTAADQETFAAKGYRYEPKRCPECRQERKTKGDRQKDNTGPRGIAPIGGSSSWGSRGGSGGGGGGGYGGGRREGGGGGGYGGGRSEGGGGGYGGGGGGGGFGGPRPSFDAVCAACGQKTTVPFEPTAGRDVYCRDCFKKRG